MGAQKRIMLADAIFEHRRAELESEEILAIQVSNSRKIASHYNLIHTAMSKPDVAGRAVMDKATGLVYVPMPNGTFASFSVIDSEDVIVETWDYEDEAADDDHNHITLGETS